MGRLTKHLTYANVVSTLCLFLLLGGAGAIAAGKLKKNSVGTKQIKANAVNGTKVADGSLSGADVDEASLGRVPSAAAADTAQKAGDASRVGGYAGECGSGAFFHLGFCLASNARSASLFFQAADTCNQAGGFMPTSSMLRSIRALSGIDLGADAATGHWADSPHQLGDGPTFGSIVVADTGGSSASSTSVGHPFRCAYALIH